uniref:Uncharacterized protein n=1 Tax=Rhizophora mucronata TaxID=61149 RepID=A0A2P2QTD7_RHIMU
MIILMTKDKIDMHSYNWYSFLLQMNLVQQQREPPNCYLRH